MTADPGLDIGPDMVNHPPHYKTGGIETIDVIEAKVSQWPGATGYRIGNAIKYLTRHRDKGSPAQDLRKALWYIERELAALLGAPPPGAAP